MKEQLSVLLQKIIYKIKWLYSNDIHYINGADTLPPPLPLEEEQRLLKTYDGTQLDVRQILIEHNLRLVVYIAKKFDNTGIGQRRSDLHRHHRPDQGGQYIPQ